MGTISTDPIGFNAGDANLYRYVGNHGTYATDPSGLIGEQVLTADERIQQIERLVDLGGVEKEVLRRYHVDGLPLTDRQFTFKAVQAGRTNDRAFADLRVLKNIDKKLVALNHKLVAMGGPPTKCPYIRGATVLDESGLDDYAMLVASGGFSGGKRTPLRGAQVAAQSSGRQVVVTSRYEGHVVLGLRNKGLAETAERIGARHFLEGDFRQAVLDAAQNPKVKISVALDGLNGATAKEKILKAVEDGLQNGYDNSFTNWEISVLFKHDRLPTCDLILDGKIIDNPFLGGGISQ